MAFDYRKLSGKIKEKIWNSGRVRKGNGIVREKYFFEAEWKSIF